VTNWRWRYESADGREITDVTTVVTEGFPAQADAESWIGETWQELLDQGVDAVTLLEEDRVVYGPMSLRPPT
jgi:hypothetical protein